LVCGFLAGYLFWGASWVIVSPEWIGLEDFLWISAAYVAVAGGSLLVPWVLIPVIATQSRRRKRVIIAVLAGLLPVVVAIGGVTFLFLGLDVRPIIKVGIFLSIAAWCVPAIGAIAHTAARGTNQLADHPKKPNPVVVVVTCIVAPLVVGFFALAIVAAAGWVTRTESPNSEQVAHAREFLLIEAEQEIEPLAYYLKRGLDYQVRFKFIARTDDPTRIFDSSYVDPSTFQPNFDFPPGEESHNEAWWDISSRPLTGGQVRAPNGNKLEIGCGKNDDGTITVYTWRRE
jgi:hypothetical protein